MTVSETPMDQIEKFLFDVSFDEDGFARTGSGSNDVEEETTETKNQEVVAPIFTEQEVETAKHDAYEKGKEEGIQNAADAIEKRMSETLENLCTRFQSLFDQQKIANAQMFEDATNTAIAIARKCFPHLTSSEALKVIENMVRTVLSELLEEPNVTIHLNETLIGPMNDRITRIAKDANFAGRILIEEDTSVAPGDCQITWGSGSAERNVDALLQLTDEIVAQNLAAARQNMEASATEPSTPIGASESMHSVENGPSPNQSQDAVGAESTSASGDFIPGVEISNTTQTSEPDEKQYIKNNTLEKDGDTLTEPTSPHEKVQDHVGASEAVARDINIPEAPLPKEPEPVNEPVPDSTLRAEEQVEGTGDQPDTVSIDPAEESTPLAKPEP